MKLNIHNNKLETNAKFTRQEFGIGDVSVVIDILRNRLYKHKIRTLVQEYLCNGRDAMRESGSDKAIKVVLPSQFEPTFKVRDYGNGVTPDRMSNVFVLYGASTKRNTNGQTGGFGIGAKSAWAYTDSFTIVTYVNGTKRTYIAHTGVNSNGSLDLIDETNTDEENGTEIQIGVNLKDIQAFRNAVFRCIYFWKEKVDIVGELENAHKHAAGHKFNDNLEVVAAGLLPNYICNQYGNEIVAIIDGIPYPINNELMEKVPMLGKLNNLINGKLLIHVNTGDLDVAATREDISDTSVDKLKKLTFKLFQDVDSFIKDEFSKVKDAFGYMKIYRDLEVSFNLSDYRSYGPYKINSHYIESDLFNKVQFFKCDNSKKHNQLKKLNLNGTSRYNEKPKIDLSQFDVLYFDESGESIVKQNKRIRTVLETNKNMILIMPKEKDANSKVAYDTLKADLQLKDLNQVAYTTIDVNVPKVKITRNKKEFCVHGFKKNYNRRYSWDSQPVFLRDSKYITLESNTTKWIYVVMNGNSFPQNKHALYELDQYLQDYRVCGISKSTLSIIKNDKNFISFDNFIKNFKPSKTEIQDAKYTTKINIAYEVLKELKEFKGIKDSFLDKMIKEYNFSRHVKLPKILLDITEKHKEINQFIKDSVSIKDLLDNKYPLLKYCDNIKDAHKNELVSYINAKYKGV